LRCAIYTRVSTDQRLEQEFNSLDAQREASDRRKEVGRHPTFVNCRPHKVNVEASRVEFLIGLPMTILFLPLWALAIWGSNRVAHYYLGDGAVVLATIGALFAAPVLLGMFGSRLHSHLMARYFEPNFGSAIKAKHAELRLKYPLAYG
jgi:hypothetical protein